MNAPGTPAAGIAWALAATFLFVSLDAVAKWLTQSYPVEQVIWARFAVHMVFALILLAPSGRAGLHSNRLGLQILRSLFMLGANAFFFFALRSIALVNATAVMFVGPLIVTALSVPFLGERVGPRRWAAVLVGFCGAMVIVQPGAEVVHPATALPLAAALCFSGYQICTRILSRHDGAYTTLAYTAVSGTVVTSAIVPIHWVSPDALGWTALIATGALGAAGQLALIRALAAAPVATVSPFMYTSLVWATLFGYVGFGDLPEAHTLLGAAIVVASGLYVLHRERRVANTGN